MVSSSLLAVLGGASLALAGTKYGGVNIAGFDFGVDTDGSQQVSEADGPVLPGPDGIGQMQHFVSADGMNLFRLPVGWQYITNANLGGSLDYNNAAQYDKLVQGCLATGSSCIIDIHNYARWNGGIVGQGGPPNSDLSGLWSQIAQKYANEPNIIFGVMNEPHDIPDIVTWAATVQECVDAIRTAGATTQMILLPGNDYTSAANFIENGSAAALSKVTNPDGSIDGLVYDVHQYLDSDSSGSHEQCVTDAIDSTFAPLATYLRTNKRTAMLSEIGGSSDASCLTDVCSAIAFLNDNSDVYVGYTGWAAGSFGTTYTLSLTPNGGSGSWSDQPLTKCFARTS